MGAEQAGQRATLGVPCHLLKHSHVGRVSSKSVPTYSAQHIDLAERLHVASCCWHYTRHVVGSTWVRLCPLGRNYLARPRCEQIAGLYITFTIPGNYTYILYILSGIGACLSRSMSLNKLIPTETCVKLNGERERESG